ncbi:hypothetical protein M0L20_28850 [Spirosoma sp. RP8]|uniref:Uncharacterized protein n=1 Tax=Spirosoma liriopis TaxID=2937440 RepID=A0ABT0HVD4_9BACT|nr:hypothetical protein [Spirosoma liriopis]MCK8495910.1 hypothetical protein [Spirosoma liriopis]
MEPNDYESDDFEDDYEDIESGDYEDAKTVEPPAPNMRRIKLTDLPNDLRFINVIHKETKETRRMTPNQFEDAKEYGWMIDKTIHN